MGLSVNDVTGIGAVADLVKETIKTIWPDKSEQQIREMALALEIVRGQTDTNKVEAASPHWFTSGWRPSIGWVCSLALFSQFVVRPWVQIIGAYTGHPMPDVPGIENQLWELMIGMLGLGGLRTYEKKTGVAS